MAREGSEGIAAPARTVRIARSPAGSLIAEANAARTDEVCGLLVGTRVDDGYEVTRLVPCDNVAPPALRTRRFEIDPRRVIEEERSLRGSGNAVIGFYHSHPEGLPVPSGTDRDYMALWPDSAWVILAKAGPSPIRAWAFDPSRPDSVIELEVTED